MIEIGFEVVDGLRFSSGSMFLPIVVESSEWNGVLMLWTVVGVF
jgi:hypothetical protein